MDYNIIQKHIDVHFDKHANYLNEETRHKIDILKRINTLGFLTDDSQDGTREIELVPDDIIRWNDILVDEQEKFETRQSRVESRKLRKINPKHRTIFFPNNGDNQEEFNYDIVHDRYRSEDGVYENGIHLSQRAYLQGYMLPELAYVFYYIFNLQTDKICTTSKDCYIPVTYAMGASNFRANEFDRKYLRNNIPIFSRMHLCDECDKTIGGEFIDDFPDDYDKFVLVRCVDPKHGRNTTDHDGLFSDIEKVLEAAKEKLELPTRSNQRQQPLFF